jgi:peptide/nickel transport system substrate-binding protein
MLAPTETPEPTPTEAPRKLVICTGAEPDTLYLYGGMMHLASNVKEAIFDGPIDSLSFDYKPVILEKLPSLADGGARLEPVVVKEGDWIVNNGGEPVALKIGEEVRPFGCNAVECAIEWNGEPLEMAQLSVDFTLLEGIHWSDGELLTASDSVFSYRLARNCLDPWSGFSCGNLGLKFKSGDDTSQRTLRYEALDERTVRWVGMPGYLDPGYQLNFFSPLPEHQLSQYQPEELSETSIAAYQPMGWGAYIIERWEPGKEISLSKNPLYFRVDEGLPHFDKLTFRFIGQGLSRNLDYLYSGECDLLELEASIYLGDYTLGDLLNLEREGKIDLHISTGTVWEHADFSLLHADYDDGYQIGKDRPDLFGDVRTRKAIAMCLDRQRVIEGVFFGQSEVPVTYLSSSHPLFNSSAAQYEFNVQAAEALLEEVGWVDHDNDPDTPRIAQGVAGVPEGTALEFSYRTNTSQQRQEVTQILAESLAQCDIQANLEYLRSEDFFADPLEGDLFSRRFDMAEFAWLTSVNPPCDLFASENIPGDPEAMNPDGTPRFPKGWSGQNNSGYSNPEFDQACRAARETLPGQPGYIENHMLAQEIFSRDLPVIPLFLRINFTISRPDFCGHRMDPTANSDTWNIEEYDYGMGCE